MTARVFSLQRSPGGVPKLPLAEADVTAEGVAGDWQSDRKHHGGPDRALCLYALKHLVALQHEGHRVYPGALGENVTVAGLDWSAVVEGARLQLGAATIEVTGYAPPCNTIAASFVDGDFTRISQKLRPGWSRVYARVLVGAIVRVADEVTLLAAEPSRDPV